MLDHPWNITPKEAVALQRELAQQVIIQPLPGHFEILAAADIGYMALINRLVAVVVTFRYPSLHQLEVVHTVSEISFPYVPGLLSFREVPPLLDAFQRLTVRPEVVLCDGQGIAHPRRLGLASHLGLCLDIPTVGCAKKRLCGQYAPLELRRGLHTPLTMGDETVGCVFCSRNGVKPIFISPGHKSDLESAVELVNCCLGPYRIPEPLRLAHNIATKLRKELLGSWRSMALPPPTTTME